MNNTKKNKFSAPFQYVWEACGRQAKEIGKMLHQSPKEIKENQKKHYRKCLHDLDYLEDIIGVNVNPYYKPKLGKK